MLSAMIPDQLSKQLDRTFPVIHTLPKALRQLLLNSGRCVSAKAGTALFEDGNVCRAFPMLLSGSIRVVKTTADGREMLLYQIEPGQFCLLTSGCLLGQTNYPASGFATTPCELLLIPPACFDELLNHDANFRTSVFRLFSERLAELMQLVEEVAFQRLDQRLARLLLTRGSDIHVSHQSLADELGSVRVIVSRLLRDFEEKGLVSLAREHIQILKPDALKSIASRTV